MTQNIVTYTPERDQLTQPVLNVSLWNACSVITLTRCGWCVVISPDHVEFESMNHRQPLAASVRRHYCQYNGQGIVLVSGGYTQANTNNICGRRNSCRTTCTCNNIHRACTCRCTSTRHVTTVTTAARNNRDFSYDTS